MINLHKGDCLVKMDLIPDKSIDLILTDPPYGTTACKWDTIIPLDKMWIQLKRIIKDNGAIVLFGSEPFSSYLRMSNIKNYKYDWIWDKNNGANFGSLKHRPLKVHEIISVFNAHNYYPQKTYDTKKPFGKINIQDSEVAITNKNVSYNHGYPKSIQEFPRVNNLTEGYYGHPTQKPVKLMEYLIKTYTNEKELVLDFTMGSGTTGVACIQLNRDFIGIELDPDYYKIAVNRIKKTVRQDELFTEEELR